MTSLSLPVILRTNILAPFWAGAPLGVLLMVLFDIIAVKLGYGTLDGMRSRFSNIGMGIGAALVGCFAYIQLVRSILGLVGDESKRPQAKRQFLWFFGIWAFGLALILLLGTISPRS